MQQVNEVTTLANEGGVAVITLDSPPVNALSAKVRDGLRAAFTQAIADDGARAIVLICAGRTFIAGADITEFGGALEGPSLAEVQALMERSPKPVVAAIHGTALGGGLEVALCAHYRIGVPSAKCGLPEVHLGLLPGAGGTQRLPRIAGPQKALEMMLTGAHVAAKECLSIGLLDRLAEEGKLREEAIAFAAQLAAERSPLLRVRDRTTGPFGPEQFDAIRAKHAKLMKGFLAPAAIIACVEAAVSEPFDTGIAKEQAAFLSLLVSDESAAQRHVFFAEREVWKIPGIDTTTPPRKVAKVGIVGAGTMGGGISMTFANAGIPVTIVETNPEALERGFGVIKKNYARSAANGRFSEAEAETRFARLTPSMDMQSLADADLIIEAVYENIDVKKEVFAKLDAIAKPGAVLATNTSALDVDEIAAVTTRPESVIGMHYFSPANVMRLLEVVKAEKTSLDVVATAMAAAKSTGKIAALVGVCFGFVGNRMLFARSLASYAMLDEGVMPWDVDRAIEDFGLAMGPFRMSDMAGLDLGWVKGTTNGETLPWRLCEMDRRGQKTGAGYYDYDANRTPSPSPVTAELVQEYAAKSGRPAKTYTQEDILERHVYLMINEAAKILAEGKAIRPSDIDVIWTSGYGWPLYRGGPMFYADLIGPEKVLQAMRGYEAEYGPAWAPAPLLVKLVEQHKHFRDLKASPLGTPLDV